MAKAKRHTPDTILDAAMEMAAETGWDELAVSDLADRLKVSSADIHEHYFDKDAMANAWFGRALRAMLAPLPEGDIDGRERMQILLHRWFDALAPYRGVTAEMLGAKMWPFHPHHWVPMIFDLSRLVQWWRDAAGRRAGGRRKQIEEITMTAIFVATLRRWCRDESENQSDTKDFLARRLALPLFD